MLACAAAETIGMSAAAGAARIVQALGDQPGAMGGAAVALAVLVAGGLVEGLALGLAQATALSWRWNRLPRRRYVLATVVVAGLGWTAGSAPGVLTADDGGAAPALWLVLAGGAGIGLVSGVMLGAAQGWAMAGAVRHPWRWVTANGVAWPLVMVVIYLGATRPEESWPVSAVLALGALTGATAGAVLGVVTWPWVSSLEERWVSSTSGPGRRTRPAPGTARAGPRHPR